MIIKYQFSEPSKLTSVNTSNFERQRPLESELFQA